MSGVPTVCARRSLASPRQARWAPLLADAAPPSFDPAGPPYAGWPGWIVLLQGGLEPDRPDSLPLRRGDYGTKSVALIAIGRAGLCYDVTPTPTDPTSWASALP